MRRFKLKEGIDRAHIPGYGRVQSGTILVGERFAAFSHVLDEILEEPAPAPEKPVIVEPAPAPAVSEPAESAPDAGPALLTEVPEEPAPVIEEAPKAEAKPAKKAKTSKRRKKARKSEE